MESYKSPAAFAKDVQVPIDKSILQNLLPASCKLELSEKTRILNLLSADGHHPDSCVKMRLCKEVSLRGYYRHRQSL